MALRVLFLGANPIWTPIESAHAALMKGFDPSEVEAFVACTDRRFGDASSTVAERFRAIPGVKVKSLDFGPSLHGVTQVPKLELLAQAPRIPAAFATLLAYVVRERIDVIHCSQKPYDAFFGVALAKLTGRASVLHLHVKHGAWFTRPVKWALANADMIVGVSQFVIDSCRAGGLPEAKLRFVHNGFDLESWRLGNDGERVRKDLGLAEDTPLLLCVGRLNQWKGQRRLLDAMPAVCEKYPRAKAVFVGEEDPFSQGAVGYRAELEAHARQLGVADNVVFTGYRGDIPDLLQAATLFVFPSWEEPFGMVYVEAMASRKSVVAIASGGANEIVKDEETGLLVGSGDQSALPAAILRLLGEPERQRQMGEAGRARVARLFHPADKAREMAALYREAKTMAGARSK